MKYKTTVQVVTWVVVLVFAVGILASGDKVEASWLRFVSAAVLVASGILTLWDLLLWKWQVIQRIPKVPPNVSGTWRGTLMSHWIDRTTGSPPPAKVAYLVVRQTATSCHVSLHTDESASDSTVALVAAAQNGSWTLDYVYLNEPELEHRDRSPIHHGGGSFRIIGKPPERVGGAYWTDRDSKGQLKFTERKKSKAQDFEACEKLFGDRTE